MLNWRKNAFLWFRYFDERLIFPRCLTYFFPQKRDDFYYYHQNFQKQTLISRKQVWDSMNTGISQEGITQTQKKMQTTLPPLKKKFKTGERTMLLNMCATVSWVDHKLAFSWDMCSGRNHRNTNKNYFFKDSQFLLKFSFSKHYILVHKLWSALTSFVSMKMFKLWTKTLNTMPDVLPIEDCNRISISLRKIEETLMVGIITYYMFDVNMSLRSTSKPRLDIFFFKYGISWV